MSPDYPSFRDLYESQEKTDEKLEKVNSRISRIEKAVFVLILIVASPKVGGPRASDLVSAVLHSMA